MHAKCVTVVVVNEFTSSKVQINLIYKYSNKLKFIKCVLEI